ncbi:hypothetical protein HDV64DRAFT_241469 [Trichoderma sp. TUCIM 5745]
MRIACCFCLQFLLVCWCVCYCYGFTGIKPLGNTHLRPLSLPTCDDFFFSNVLQVYGDLRRSSLYPAYIVRT